MVFIEETRLTNTDSKTVLRFGKIQNAVWKLTMT